MKRFITMIVAVCAFFAVSAQNPMVTLSHNGELSFFTNITALNSAIEAAVDGDVLYLSEGSHILENGQFSIPYDKRLSIVGTGYKTHIIGEVKVYMTTETSDSKLPLFDGVRLDKLSFTDDDNSLVNNYYKGTSEIRRCWIKTLSSGAYAGKNITYNGCFIEYGGFGGSGTVIVKNSKIRYAPGNGFAALVNVINCHVDSAQYYPKTMISSIFNNTKDVIAYETNDEPTYSIINSILRTRPETYSRATVTTQDCYIWEEETPNFEIFDDNLECQFGDLESIILGADGTVVGIHGGESPFSENPSVPTVDSANSTVEYDATSNKLKVNITVKAD